MGALGVPEGDGPFWEKPLDSLNAVEWESLCDGCGKCCLHKVEDEDTGRIYFTNVRCRLLDGTTARCGDYTHRHAQVPDCVRLKASDLADLPWLPVTCAYRLRAAGEPLPDWHYLKSGDREDVHRAGHSIRGWTVAEDDAGDWEDHLVHREI